MAKKKVGGKQYSPDNVTVSNPEETPIRPIDMPGKGAHPSQLKSNKK